MAKSFFLYATDLIIAHLQGANQGQGYNDWMKVSLNARYWFCFNACILINNVKPTMLAHKIMKHFISFTPRGPTFVTILTKGRLFHD